MKKIVPLFIVLVILLVTGAWMMIENKAVKENNESKISTTNKNTDLQPSIEQVKEGDENKEPEKNEIEVVDEEPVEEADSSPETSFDNTQEKTLFYKQERLHFSYLDARKLYSEFDVNPIDKISTIEDTAYIVTQEIYHPTKDVTFRMLIEDTPLNRESVSENNPYIDCFNGDSFINSRGDNPPYLSIWKNEELVVFDTKSLEEMGYAANGCNIATKWHNDKLVLQHLSGGGQAIWLYDYKNNKNSLAVSYETWSEGGLGSNTTGFMTWRSNKGAFVQIVEPNEYYGQIYVLSPEQSNDFAIYTSDKLPAYNVKYKTNGYVAWTNLLSEKTLDNIEKGLTFTINDKEIFLAW